MNAIATQGAQTQIRFGNVAVDIGLKEVRFDNGDRRELSERECQLLQYFANNSGKVISRDELMSKVWRLHPGRIFTRVIDMHVAHLRRKLRNTESRVLRTVYGQGYVFSPETR